MGANKFDAKKQTVASAGSSEIIGQIQTTSGETITDFADGTSEIKIGGSGEVIKVPPINQL